jgi:hypothetical protein
MRDFELFVAKIIAGATDFIPMLPMIPERIPRAMGKA